MVDYEIARLAESSLSPDEKKSKKAILKIESKISRDDGPDPASITLLLVPFRWNRAAESPIRDWPISTRERVHARQYRLPGDRRRGRRDGRVHRDENGFPRENEGYVTQSRRRVRVFFLFFLFLSPFFTDARRARRNVC